MIRKSWMLTFQMLSGVDYTKLNSNGLLAKLEAAVIRNLFELIAPLQATLSAVGLVATPKLMVGYLSSYLGFLVTSALGETKAGELRTDIEELIGHQAEYAYDMFAKYPLHIGLDNLRRLRNATSGLIVDQTLNLCRVLDEAMELLETNHEDDSKPRLLSPLDPFFIPCIRAAVQKTIQHNQYKGSDPFLYIINHTAVQIGWLIGHYSCLESKCKDAVLDYMLYVIPSIAVYMVVK